MDWEAANTSEFSEFGQGIQNVVEDLGRLWVGNLDYQVREADLQALFERYGSLKSVDVMMERDDPAKSRGYAFIEFEEREDALKAQEGLNGETFFGRALQINDQQNEFNNLNKQNWNQNNNNNNKNNFQNAHNPHQEVKFHYKHSGARLFVGNLDFGVRKEDLMPIFEEFGHLESCIVIMDRENPNKSRGFGFVQYSFQADAERAAEEVDGMVLRGRTVRVNIAAPKGSAELEQNKKNYKNRYKQNKDKISRRIYVGNLDYKVRERDLRPIFEKFGALTKVQVMFEQDNPEKSRGYGFVEFENAGDATQAAQEMNDYVLLGRNMRVNMATYKNLQNSNEDDSYEDEDEIQFAGPHPGINSGFGVSKKRSRGRDSGKENGKKRKMEQEVQEETESDLFGDDRSSPEYVSYKLTRYVLQTYRAKSSHSKFSMRGKAFPGKLF